MELDKEDAEAGSILIALANHQPQQRPMQLSQVNSIFLYPRNHIYSLLTCKEKGIAQPRINVYSEFAW